MIKKGSVLEGDGEKDKAGGGMTAADLLAMLKAPVDAKADLAQSGVVDDEVILPDILDMAPTCMHGLMGAPCQIQTHTCDVLEQLSSACVHLRGCITRSADKVHQSVQMLAKLLDRTHLLDGKKPPYPVTGKGYQCVQQVGQQFATRSVSADSRILIVQCTCVRSC